VQPSVSAMRAPEPKVIAANELVAAPLRVGGDL
jgi:hypothetical protein